MDARKDMPCHSSVQAWVREQRRFLLSGGRQMLMSVQRRLAILACERDRPYTIAFESWDRKNKCLEPAGSVRRQFVDQVVIRDFVRDVATHDCRKRHTAVHNGNIDI